MGLIAFWRRTPSAVLLIVQLAGLLIYPLLLGNLAGRIGFEAFSLIVLTLAVFSVRATPGLTWVSIILGLPALVTSVIVVFGASVGMLAASSVLHALFYFYAAYSLIRYMLADRKVTVDELYATGATFTLVAWGFAYVFLFVQVLQPGSFSTSPGADTQGTWLELLYLSFTTLTSTGLSDIYPLTPWSRSVLMFEQLAGVAFVAMVVSRMVSLSVMRMAAGRVIPGPVGPGDATEHEAGAVHATTTTTAPDSGGDGGPGPAVGARS